MTLKERVKKFRAGRKRYLVTLALAVLVLVLFGYSYWTGRGKAGLIYADSLEMTAVEVNGIELTLREVAFYVAYEEDQVEQQALAYDAEDTGKYWNIHTDEAFIRTAARNAAIQMAIHDELFYQMAVAEQIELSEEEETALKSHVDDFWSDLVDDQKDIKLGIEREDIEKAMQKAAYAEKMQRIYAELHNRDYEDYDFSTDTYAELLDEQDYTINKDVWSRIDFGNITLEH